MYPYLTKAELTDIAVRLFDEIVLEGSCTPPVPPPTPAPDLDRTPVCGLISESAAN